MDEIDGTNPSDSGVSADVTPGDEGLVAGPGTSESPISSGWEAPSADQINVFSIDGDPSAQRAAHDRAAAFAPHLQHLRPLSAPFEASDSAFARESDAALGDEAATYTLAPSPQRSKGKRFAAIGAATALFAAGGFGAWQIAAGNDGGAESPEAAVEALLAAANNEDAIGALDIMLPGERRTMKQPMLDMVKELTRMEVLSPAADIAKVEGLDIEIATNELSSSAVADDIVTVAMSGSSRVSADGNVLPLGDAITRIAGQAPTFDETETMNFEDARITTVKKDGRWYVSLFYSIAENARAGSGAAAPPDVGLVARGGATPEEGMDLFLDAIADLSIDGLIASLNPEEAEALQRYAPLFLNSAQAEIDEATSEVNVEIALSDVTYTVTPISDGRVGVVPKTLTATVTAKDTDVAVTFADGCVNASGTVNSEDVKEDWCFDKNTSAEPGSTDSTQPPATETAETSDPDGASSDESDSVFATEIADMTESWEAVNEALSDIESAGITMVRTDGEWYVAPIGMVMDNALNLMRAVDKDEVQVIAENGTASFLRLIFGGYEAFGLAGSDESFTSSYEPTDCAFRSEGFIECYDAAIADGTIDILDTPVEYQFQECGIDVSFPAGTETLSDEDFMALVTAANACFQRHVAAGDMPDYKVPVFVATPECYNDVNVFSAPGGPTYNDVLDCVYG